MTTPQTAPSEEAISQVRHFHDGNLADIIDAEFAALREKLKSYENDTERRNGVDAIYAGMRVENDELKSKLKEIELACTDSDVMVALDSIETILERKGSR